jgi:GH15 family glucan-1,4-alpha-glucosidase
VALKTPTNAGETVLNRHPDIAEHGLIGDLQTAALITTDGTVDFFCCPRFDSPSVFASLLLINAAIELNEQLDRGSNVGEPVLATR